MKFKKFFYLLTGIFCVTSSQAVFADNLDFSVNVGTDKNYFVQSENGAFHVILSKTPKSRCVIASPAGNSGCALLFRGNEAPKLMGSPIINGKESVTINITSPSPHLIDMAILGSLRVVRDHTEGHALNKSLKRISDNIDKLKDNPERYKAAKDWLNPTWKKSDDGRAITLHLTALDTKNWYELQIKSEDKQIYVDKKHNFNALKSTIKLPAGEIAITYSSSFTPLTPFTLKELLNKKALETVSKADNPHITKLLNGLRFLTYREKYLAGSWRFLTYFGRDSLLSLRMLIPILTPDAVEAGITAAAARINKNGEVAHEEDIGDQAIIDQLTDSNGSTYAKKGYKNIINNYNMIDQNFLLLPLLLDYYYIGGRNVFKNDSETYVPICRNLNLVFKQIYSEKPISLKKGMDAGDWRDSNTGLGYGKYPFSVNAAMVPSALESFDILINKKAWNKNELLKVAEKENFTYLKKALNESDSLNKAKETWFNMWSKYLIKQPAAERTKLLNENRKELGFTALKEQPPYTSGFLGLSLKESLKPVPIIQSDTLFMLLDFSISDRSKWFTPACAPFEINLPDGLMSDAGMIVANPALAGEKYRKMFDVNHYHGEVIWAWPQLMLKVALMKQLGKWITPSPSGDKLSSKNKAKLTQILSKDSELLNKLSKWATSELWAWKLDKSGHIIPVAYGQDAANDTESNAVQLWSVAALGPELWDLMNKNK